MKTIYLLTNSPGEVSTFARPMVRTLHQRHPDWNLQVCLVPCPYATGAEASVISSWPESPSVWTPWQTTKAWFQAQGRGKEGAVVFLGGDPWHALALKRRFGLPAVAYFFEPNSWEGTRWLGGFDASVVGYERPAGLNDKPERRSIPDLRVDAVQERLQQGEPDGYEGLTLALFPGSRWLHLKAVLGPFLHMFDEVSQRVPGVRLLIAASPFITREKLADAAAKPFNLALARTTAELRGDALVTERGTEAQVVWGDPYKVMVECDMAVSLPGTNTAELAIAGKPTLIPLTSRVPVGGAGILGLLDRVPGFSKLKRRLRERKKERLSLIALPNQLAGRVVMPEFMISDDMHELIDLVAEILPDEERRSAIGHEAQDVMGPPGGAEQLARIIEELVR